MCVRIGVKMGENSNVFNLLLCHESDSCLNEDEETTIAKSQHDLCWVEIEDEEEEYVTELARRECSQLKKTTSSQAPVIRTAAIDWILSTGAKFGFRNQTSYMAISYLDLFIARRFMDGDEESWAIRLTSLACLSVAAKMEETVTPEFPEEDFGFRANVIRKMELLVLARLNWRTNLVTPFNYLHYMVAKISENHPSNLAKGLLFSKSSESLLEIVKDISFRDHLQFAVAAAAVLAALDSKLSKEEIEMKLQSITWWISSENESVFWCYRRMQEIEKTRERTPESAVSPEICIGSKRGSKRRLSFDDFDQTCSSPETLGACFSE